MFVGFVNGRECSVWENAANQSILLTGISGSGKSCKLQQMELRAALSGNTVVILDISQNHGEDDILPRIADDYRDLANRIFVNQGEFNLNLLGSFGEENEHSRRNSCVQALCGKQYFGVVQKAIVREALEKAEGIRKQRNCSDGEAIKSVFLAHSEMEWIRVYEKLWYVLNSGALQEGKKKIQPGKINILELGADDIATGEILAELVLSYFWRICYYAKTKSSTGRLILVLDEFQHCSLKYQAILPRLLTEGRKFGIDLILATQTLGIFSREEKALLEQPATRLYFKPAEAEMRELKKYDGERRKILNGEINRLKRGECIANGELVVGKQLIRRPLLLT